MIALGIETATSVCGAALLCDGRADAERVLDETHVHSEQLVPMIGELLETSGIGVGNLDIIAVSIGPGSFTGLRIGLSVAKGLSVSAGIPIVPVPTLEALALAAVIGGMSGTASEIISLIDAHRGEAFGAIFRRGEGSALEEVRRPEIVPYCDIEAWAESRPGSMLAGSELRHTFSEHLRHRYVETRCSPISVAMIGIRCFLPGGRTDISMLEPMYLREFIPRNDSGMYHTNKGA